LLIIERSSLCKAGSRSQCRKRLFLCSHPTLKARRLSAASGRLSEGFHAGSGSQQERLSELPFSKLRPEAQPSPKGREAGKQAAQKGKSQLSRLLRKLRKLSYLSQPKGSRSREEGL
jgi:hypothetical protein